MKLVAGRCTYIQLTQLGAGVVGAHPLLLGNGVPDIVLSLVERPRGGRGGGVSGYELRGAVVVVVVLVLHVTGGGLVCCRSLLAAVVQRRGLTPILLVRGVAPQAILIPRNSLYTNTHVITSHTLAVLPADTWTRPCSTCTIARKMG